MRLERREDWREPQGVESGSLGVPFFGSFQPYLTFTMDSDGKREQKSFLAQHSNRKGERETCAMKVAVTLRSQGVVIEPRARHITHANI